MEERSKSAQVVGLAAEDLEPVDIAVRDPLRSRPQSSRWLPGGRAIASR